MDAHIDWVSFTLSVGQGANVVDYSSFLNEAHRLLLEVGKDHYGYLFNGASFEPLAGRAPFRYSMVREDRGVRIFGGGPNERILYELSGRACEGLRDAESYQAFLGPLLDHLTRFDLAVDIRTEVRPSIFANEREHQRFKSVGYIKSSSGETCYVGSPKSDRFARVYRYDSPHPRSENLRIEFVFRRNLARDAARSLCFSNSIMEFCSSAGQSWGWKHAVWQPSEIAQNRLRTPIQHRETNDTVAWLYRSVAPSIARLLQSGDLDWDDFVRYIWYGDTPKDSD